MQVQFLLKEIAVKALISRLLWLLCTVEGLTCDEVKESLWLSERLSESM